MIGTEGIVRGATVRVITKEKPIYLSRPVQNPYPLEFLSEGREHGHFAFVIRTQKF